MEITRGRIIEVKDFPPVNKDWIIRVCKEEGIEGYYIYLEDTKKRNPGFDEFVFSLDDIKPQIAIWELEVAWEKPIESILEEENK